MFLDTFTENVINLAVESCLMRELEHIFSPEMVRRINSDDLMDLVTGSQHRTTEQAELEEEVQNLEGSLDLCRRHMRPRIPRTINFLVSETRLQG